MKKMDIAQRKEKVKQDSTFRGLMREKNINLDEKDGVPAVPSDVSDDSLYIWMLPSTTSVVILACLLAPAHASTFATDLTSAFSGFSYWTYL
ncbi:hypothetical protein AVEN_206382-1 [Araneus ventricosus]|uniref:Uncharacterized protein n=1 Tax=Araneus ventricosus TaxID=182803 RepID=A0A4Y2MTI8_ARAVE|nr:hypothetical protein AVEN_206382-1 [Araneus ventricosus]